MWSRREAGSEVLKFCVVQREGERSYVRHRYESLAPHVEEEERTSDIMITHVLYITVCWACWVVLHVYAWVCMCRLL